MKNVNITFRIEEDLKKEADALFTDLGMSLSTAFHLFLKQSLREQGLPFVVTRNVPNQTTLAAMDAAERGEDLSEPFDSVEELRKNLNA